MTFCHDFAEVTALKSRILALLIICSVLLNIAGLVFFILFLNLRGSYKSVRRDKSIMERNLAVMRSQDVMSDALSSDRITRKNFVSHADGEMDYFAFQPPAFRQGATDYTLVLYLHGMGSNYMEPFVVPHDLTVAQALASKDPTLGILSCSYRKESSWGSDKAISDINQNVREILQQYPFKRIVVMGVSMGGSVALNYACVAPFDIKKKIVGVVSMESAGDLGQLYKVTTNQDIRTAMIMSLGGMPKQIPEIYKNKSFLSNSAQLNEGIKFYILSAKSDQVVPPQLQIQSVNVLKDAGYQVKFVEIDGNHHSPKASYYVEGLQFVLGQSS